MGDKLERVTVSAEDVLEGDVIVSYTGLYPECAWAGRSAIADAVATDGASPYEDVTLEELDEAGEPKVVRKLRLRGGDPVIFPTAEGGICFGVGQPLVVLRFDTVKEVAL